jgi:hypothetical protein
MLISDFNHEVSYGRRYDGYAGTTCYATRTTDDARDSCPPRIS